VRATRRRHRRGDAVGIDDCDGVGAALRRRREGVPQHRGNVPGGVCGRVWGSCTRGGVDDGGIDSAAAALQHPPQAGDEELLPLR
jgi:hypothetical protein